MQTNYCQGKAELCRGTNPHTNRNFYRSACKKDTWRQTYRMKADKQTCRLTRRHADRGHDCKFAAGKETKMRAGRHEGLDVYKGAC